MLCPGVAMATLLYQSAARRRPFLGGTSGAVHLAGRGLPGREGGASWEGWRARGRGGPRSTHPPGEGGRLEKLTATRTGRQTGAVPRRGPHPGGGRCSRQPPGPRDLGTHAHTRAHTCTHMHTRAAAFPCAPAVRAQGG